MNHSNILSPHRLWLLLKMELLRTRNGMLIAFLILFGLNLIDEMVKPFLLGNNVYDAHPQNYIICLLIGGFIYSSLLFSDLSNKLKRSNYLSLPASTLEKYLSVWLLSCIGWIVIFTLSFMISTGIANTIGGLIFRNIHYVSFNPLSWAPLEAVKYYIVTQGIFMLGAVHFRGYVFPKTVFAIIILALIWLVVVFFTLKDPFLTDHECSSPAECELLIALGMDFMWLASKWLFWWALAPLCWVLTYFGLKEQEV